MAGIIALVNDARLAAGQPPLGFLNPLPYGSAHLAFKDITDGSSFGCKTKGFPSAQGWDCVTGLGTPIFPKLVAAALGRGGSGIVEAEMVTDQNILTSAE